MLRPLVMTCLCLIPSALCAADTAGAAPKEAARPLRVLLFAGGPTREYQFVRSLLVHQRDAKRAELSVCLQPQGKEAKRGVVQDVPAERLLRGFPDRLKSADPDERYAALGAYDVVVAFDPDWGRLSGEALAELKRWVESGGGLVVVAGPVHTPRLARKDAAEKLGPVLDLLPVVPADARTADVDASKPRRLKFAGKPGEHPFLALDDRASDFRAGWEEFFTGRRTPGAELRRGFFSYSPVREVKEKAAVVATLDDAAARMKDGQGQPYLATMAAGKGRVVYLGSGETWRLRQYRTAYHERFWLTLLAYAAGAAPRGPSVPAGEPERPSVSLLRLEVQALQTLYHFQLNADQMAALAEWAPQTAADRRERKPGKASDDYRQVLTDLRNALIDANDEEGIDALEDKLDELTEGEKPELDDDVEVTAAARRRAPELLRRLKPRQLAHYIGHVEDDVPDPREQLRDFVEKARSVKDKEWEEKRDEVAEDVAWLAAGADAEPFERVRGRAAALLNRARGLSAEELHKRQDELEREVDRVVGDVGPTAVLEHAAQRALAELLANPRLAAALKARLK